MDYANNEEYRKIKLIKIDKTEPQVTIYSPVLFEVYPSDSTTLYNFTASDNLDTNPDIMAYLYNSDWVEIGTPLFGEELPHTSGVYYLVVNATDDAGLESSTQHMFVVYSIEAGFASGSGWITPEQDNFKAIFGFIANYQKDSTEPDGNLQFHYQFKDIKLKSDFLNWLTISNNKVIFQGNCTINGESSYTFRVEAIDGDFISGANDSFHIIVWEGIDTEADPLYNYKGDLGAGNIKILKK